eukprot:TRINITY_DN57440_c0_g1_i1.p1 TRINITY_DN57440_c0_g1~~TRINITY_DN57440_c0_g1_i1.p1  ORF type:complete len:137 (-),score=34.22 TRINITY_DN57440_c0_g1_i1:33-443(-)
MAWTVLTFSLLGACSLLTGAGGSQIEAVAVDAGGIAKAGSNSLLRKEAADGDRNIGDGALYRADCTNLELIGDCQQLVTAATCESAKSNEGSETFRCSWKQSVPSGSKTQKASPAECYLDKAVFPCGLTNGTGTAR